MADEGTITLSITDQGGIAVTVTLPEEYLFNKPFDMVRYEFYRRFEEATPKALELINNIRTNDVEELIVEEKEPSKVATKPKTKAKATKKK